jgi:hypothetical protein
MHRTYAKSFLFVFLLLTHCALAQSPKSNRENAPYSRFGIGELRNGSNTFMKGMAGISSAYTSAFNVNTDNPASYASLQLTTYEAGAEGNTRTLMAGADKYKTGAATVSYMHVGFPIGKYAGMALGLKPVSRVYYALADTTQVDSIGLAVKQYEGDGSISQGFIGFAGKYKQFSLGFNFSYLFGNIGAISSLEPLTDTQKVMSSRFFTNTKVGGIYWNLGAMYQQDLTKKIFMRVGATVTLSQTLNATRDRYWISYWNQADTALSNVGAKGKIQLPMNYSAGVLLVANQKWTVGLNYNGANWSNYSNYGAKDSLAASTYKMSVGMEYTPDASGATKNYLSKVTYRIGGYYGTDPVMLRGIQLNYYAATAGITLPFRKNVSRVHMSVEVGSRGTKNSGLVKETFVRFGLGLSLNDKWFVKRVVY